MATRRSRLSIKPNVGPKVAAKGPSAPFTKPIKTLKDATESPKKEIIQMLQKKTSAPDEAENDETDSRQSIKTDLLQRLPEDTVSNICSDNGPKSPITEEETSVEKKQLGKSTEKENSNSINISEQENKTKSPTNKETNISKNTSSNTNLESSLPLSSNEGKRKATFQPVPGAKRQRHVSLTEGASVLPLERRHRHLSVNDVISSDIKHMKSGFSAGDVSKASQPHRKAPKIDIPDDAPVDKTKVKMSDLIYWNPTKNPMKKKEKKKQDMAYLSPPKATTLSCPPPEPKSTERTEALPVPQVKIGPDGNIILNEESLVIHNEASEPVIESEDVIDETDSTTTYRSFRKQPKRLPWSKKNTAKFYRALRYMGTDFSLMRKVFPDFEREDLKKKFMFEDRHNRDKVEEALRNSQPFSLEAFKKDQADNEDNDDDDDEDEEGNKIRPKQKQKYQKVSEEEKRPKQKKRPRRKTKFQYYVENDEERSHPREHGEKNKSAKKNAQKLQQKSNQPLGEEPLEKDKTKEDSSEIVQILMSMKGAGKNLQDTELDSPEGSGNESSNPLANLREVIKQGSSHVTVLDQDGPEPLVLVYKTPDTPGAETVIHVYKIQKEDLHACTSDSKLAPSTSKLSQPSSITSSLSSSSSSLSLLSSTTSSKQAASVITQHIEASSAMSSEAEQASIDINLSSASLPGPVSLISNTSTKERSLMYIDIRNECSEDDSSSSMTLDESDIKKDKSHSIMCQTSTSLDLGVLEKEVEAESVP